MYKYSKDGVSVLTVLDKRKQKMNGLFPIKVQVSTTENRNITPPGKKFLLETGKYYHIPKIVTYLKYGVTSKIVFL